MVTAEAWKEWDYELLGEIGKPFMDFPIALCFISENLRYKPTENTGMFLNDSLDRAPGMVLFLNHPHSR